jgi:AcrR family transcriptional regulator
MAATSGRFSFWAWATAFPVRAPATPALLGMGFAPLSFYVAFGNKEALFLRVVETYQTTQAESLAAALARPTTREVVARLLDGFTHPPTLCSAPSDRVDAIGPLTLTTQATVPVRCKAG